jgi:thiamine biosynthesis lipoprotein
MGRLRGRVAVIEPAKPGEADELGLVTPPGLARVRFPAMGTTVTVIVPQAHQAAAGEVERLFAHWEATFSRFRPDSELSRLNRSAGQAVRVSRLLFDVVASAVSAAAATDGLFDPTILPRLEELGYDRSFETLPPDRPAGPTSDRGSILGGWTRIVLDERGRRIRLAPGTALDLGGIAKGMAVDAAITTLAAAGIAPAAVEAGGDLAVHGLPPDRSAWPIAVETPWGDDVAIALAGGAIATSSVGRRRWRVGGVVRHHLIDPRTGQPAWSGLWSVTVAASTCRGAEVAAKAALLLGPEAGAAFMEERGLSALFITQAGELQRVGRWGRSDEGSRGEPQHTTAALGRDSRLQPHGGTGELG